MKADTDKFASTDPASFRTHKWDPSLEKVKGDRIVA